MRIVGDDGIAAVLGDDTDGYNNGKPPSVALGLKEVQVTGSVSNLSLYAESFPDFTVLELDSQVVLIAVGVVFGQGLEGLLVAVLGDQPSRRLGNDFRKRSAKCYQGKM
jgi:hypothetical protein